MNRGKQLNYVNVLTFSGAIKLIEGLKSSGRIFRIDFIKKDGSERTMICRFGVRSKLSGTGAKYSFIDKGLLSVYEFGKGYRSIKLDKILGIKSGDTMHSFGKVNDIEADVLPLGITDVSEQARKNGLRTLRAATSPLYDN